MTCANKAIRMRFAKAMRMRVGAPPMDGWTDGWMDGWMDVLFYFAPAKKR